MPEDFHELWREQLIRRSSSVVMISNLPGNRVAGIERHPAPAVDQTSPEAVAARDRLLAFRFDYEFAQSTFVDCGGEHIALLPISNLHDLYGPDAHPGDIGGDIQKWEPSYVEDWTHHSPTSSSPLGS
jgi:hypothetical protein